MWTRLAELAFRTCLVGMAFYFLIISNAVRILKYSDSAVLVESPVVFQGGSRALDQCGESAGGLCRDRLG